jgi:hypothetical protein
MEGPRHPIGAVLVGHQALDAHAMGGEETVHCEHEGNCRTLCLIWQDSDEGNPARIIDGDMEIVVTAVLFAPSAN